MSDLSLARKVAILTYLSRNSVKLSQLAAHFGTSTQRMRKELTELFVVEIRVGGFLETPVELHIPEDDGEVSLIVDQTEISPRLSLSECISVLALIDQIFPVVKEDVATELLALRSRIVDAASARGYAAAMWAAPRPILSPQLADKLTYAIAKRQLVEISYLKSVQDRVIVDQAVVAPIEIITGNHPLLLAGKGEERRHYRLDRISAITILDQTYSKAFAASIQAQDSAISGETVKLICAPQARWVVEHLPVEKVSEVDGQLHIELPMSSITWLRSLLVRLGPAVQAVEPAHIAAQIAETAKLYLEAYQ